MSAAQIRGGRGDWQGVAVIAMGDFVVHAPTGATRRVSGVRGAHVHFAQVIKTGGVTIYWATAAECLPCNAPAPVPEYVAMARANAEHLRERDGWCRKCGWDSSDARCPLAHPADCDGVI